ncbi:alpha/beta fold hydrolase [Sporosarcina cyprini]|uniref:alpha/beta fold hydrolase n=1 Tax=Sporosarcina cyprini TaxID=2910523 RepID=UPI001EDE7B42|nr:alpha/beta hydrolase [Sporosarcina cyprini]MCG3088542.1 alpha/beta hydrolase [Sporosarcina cyprini]
MKSQYYEWGNPDKPTLVFLHGLGSSGLSFGELAQLTMNDFHVISFDLPGHGGAAGLANEEDYLPSRMAQRLHLMLHSLELTDIYLVGHSWGAHLALYVAGMDPETINGVILLDGGYFQQDPFGDSLEQQLSDVDGFIESIRFPSWEAMLTAEKANSSRWSEQMEAASLAQFTEIESEIRLAVSPFTAKSIIKGMDQQPTGEIFSKVQCPVFLMHSTLPEELEYERHKAINYLKAGIPQIEILSIPDTSHDIYWDAPDLIARYIKDWVSRQVSFTN